MPPDPNKNLGGRIGDRENRGQGRIGDRRDVSAMASIRPSSAPTEPGCLLKQVCYTRIE
jgi:hypothetical protein